MCAYTQTYSINMRKFIYFLFLSQCMDHGSDAFMQWSLKNNIYHHLSVQLLLDIRQNKFKVNNRPGGRHFSWLLDSLRCRRDLSRPISGQRSWRALLLRSNDCSLAKFPIAGHRCPNYCQKSKLT